MFMECYEKLFLVLLKQVSRVSDEDSGNYREINMNNRLCLDELENFRDTAQQTFLSTFDMLGQKYLLTSFYKIQVTRYQKIIIMY